MTFCTLTQQQQAALGAASAAQCEEVSIITRLIERV